MSLVRETEVRLIKAMIHFIISMGQDCPPGDGGEEVVPNGEVMSMGSRRCVEIGGLRTSYKPAGIHFRFLQSLPCN